MEKLLPTPPKKVAIFRALQIGDMLCAIPAIRAFKQAYPESQITLIGLPWAESLARRFHTYFSGFISFPGYPGLPEQAWQTDEVIPFLQQTQLQEFDLVLQMHGNGGIVNPMLSLLRTKQLAGFYEPGRYCPNPLLFTAYPEEGSEVRRMLRLMTFMGIELQGEHLEFPVFADEERAFEELRNRYGLQPKRYICIHPGARDNRRWWSSQNFARVADEIADQGYTIVLTGTDAEQETVRSVVTAMRNPVINLAGKTGLGTLAILIRQASMLLCNDTGVSHIAAAVKTPSVVIFLASDPKRWAPLDIHRHRIILPNESEHMAYVLHQVEQALIYGLGETEAYAVGMAGW